MIIDLTNFEEHKIQEVICVKCGQRWLAVFPQKTLLKDIECPKCHEQGYVIGTGQDLTAMQNDGVEVEE